MLLLADCHFLPSPQLGQQLHANHHLLSQHADAAMVKIVC
jgi:hypothetical protein